MSRSIVYLFPDTNLLLQCRPLKDLDWSTWNEFDEVRLIVSAPVLREIDYRKNRGNDRAGKRARAASAMFREMLADGYKLVHDGRPCVKLFVESQHGYSETLREHLNYQERDDQLIGTVYEFAERTPDAEVRLLTHDTTPLYTAKAYGLATDIIPDVWLLSPENTEPEKELTALRLENARLKNAEPQFESQCLDRAGIEIQRYECSFTWFDPLSDAEIDDLMQYLKERFPLVTDFGPQESAERGVEDSVYRLLGGKEVFVPATDEEIRKYREESYPQWLEACKESLSNYHQTLQNRAVAPGVVFVAENRGTRPATDALITIEAEGSFQVKPPVQDEENEDDSNGKSKSFQKNRTTLLPPPAAPRGRWKTIGPFSELHHLLTHISGETALPGNKHNVFQLPQILPHVPKQRDPNDFYFKPNRPLMPQDTFQLECEQWRHQDGKEEFDCEIHFSPDIDTVKGALVFRIQAGNLAKTQSTRIPVRIGINHLSSFDHARALVESLARRPKFGVK